MDRQNLRGLYRCTPVTERGRICREIYVGFLTSDMFEEVGEKAATGTRPARLYRVKEGADIYHFERNLLKQGGTGRG